MGQVEGKVALVTGGASGIGAACAMTLAREGAKVVVTDIDDRGGAEVVKSIAAAGGEAIYLRQDVTEEPRWIEIVAEIEKRFKRLDVLVSNAGIGVGAPTIVEMTLADWRRQTAINLDGVFLSVKHCIPAMRRSGGGSIVMMSSVAGLRGSPTLAGYCATKGGVRLFAKSIAMECAGANDGIRVNSVHPGIIDTPIWGKIPREASGMGHNAPMRPDELAKLGVPLGFAGEAQDIANGVLFLAACSRNSINSKKQGRRVVKIGFIGVGAMGGPMSRNIVGKTNHEVTVFDLNPAAMEACIKAGAKRGASVADIASSCEIVMMSLPTPKHVEAVIAGPGGVAENAKAGTVVIDLSTNSPAVIKKLGEVLAAKGITLIEAPVTGGVIKATDGTLTIIVGGDEAAIDKQRPLLSSIGALVVHTGPHGSASVGKLINNMLGLCNAAVAAEGMMIATMAGVDLNKIVEVVSNGSGNSNAFRNILGRSLKGNFEASFALDLAYKDLGLAVDLAAEYGMPGMVAPQVLNLMRMARGMGLGQGDSTSVIKVYESMLGKQARLK